MKKNTSKFLIISKFALIVISITIQSKHLNAQSNVYLEWANPIKISNNNKFAYTPFLVSDSAGNLHVVWSQNDQELKEEDLDLDTIYYATNSYGDWSLPVDIFVAKDNGQARVTRLRIDQNDRLHVLWVGRPNILYANAYVLEAGNLKSWKTISIAENAYFSDLAISLDGTLHIVYILDRDGIYYTHSSDEGQEWSIPNKIWQAPDYEHSSGSVRIEVDENDIIHVAWGITAGSNNWNPIGIVYARSEDKGETWNTTLEVMEGDNLPNIGFDGSGGVHVVWDNPAGTNVGRGHAWSQDSGKTWKTIERIFPGYRGQTLWPVMASDSAGTLHLITAANSPESGESQIFHSIWETDKWLEPQLVSKDHFGGEGPSIAVSEGNLLNLVWFSYHPDEYSIWYSRAQSEAPWIPPQEIEPLNVSIIDIEEGTISEKEQSNISINEQQLENNSIQQINQEPSILSDPWVPLAAGSLSVGLLIMIVLLFKFQLNSRR
jgi:hypothetical protein